VPRPEASKFIVRLPSELKEWVAARAEAECSSMNSVIVRAIKAVMAVAERRAKARADEEQAERILAEANLPRGTRIMCLSIDGGFQLLVRRPEDDMDWLLARILGGKTTIYGAEVSCTPGAGNTELQMRSATPSSTPAEVGP
jgi:hypothetical protein